MNDIDIILNKLRENSGVLSNYHRKRFLKLKSRLKFYRIPIIVISAINSVSAVSLQPFMKQNYISLINMMLSLLVGIVSSIEMFYGLNKQMEIELTGSKEFYILSTDIYKYLSLTRENRNIDGRTFLTDSYTRYISMYEKSIILKHGVVDKLVEIDITPDNSPDNSPTPSEEEFF